MVAFKMLNQKPEANYWIHVKANCVSNFRSDSLWRYTYLFAYLKWTKARILAQCRKTLTHGNGYNVEVLKRVAVQMWTRATSSFPSNPHWTAVALSHACVWTMLTYQDAVSPLLPTFNIQTVGLPPQEGSCWCLFATYTITHSSI